MPRLPANRRKVRTTTVTGENGQTREIHLRRAHKKSHLGCKNCKARRIKCDEVLPICAQCKRANADCSYLAYTPEEARQHEEKRNQANAANAAAAAAVVMAPPAPQDSSDNSETPASAMPYKLPSPAPIQFVEQVDLFGEGPKTATSTGTGTEYSRFVPGTSIAPVPATLQDTLNLPPINVSGDDMRVSLPSLGQGFAVTSLTEKQSRIPELERRSLATTLAIARQGFETDFMRDAYANWMNNMLALAYHHTCLFHATMAFSFGFSYIKSGHRHYLTQSDKHRFIALREIQQELQKITPANTDALLSTSLLLSWDVFLQEDNIASYITLSRGLGAVLEQVHSVSSTTQMALCMSESLFQSVKTILHPSYDTTFFAELQGQIRQLTTFIQESQDATLMAEHVHLMDYTQRMGEFLSTSARDSELNYIHDPCYLFDFMREWLAKFPSTALASLDVQSDMHALVLHIYFHAVTRALDAILPEARYLFQFSFVGPIDLVGPENCGNYVTDPNILALLEYPLRIITFFKKRQVTLNKLFVAVDPLMANAEGVPLYRLPPQEPVREHFTKSFAQNFEFHTHMPYIAAPSRNSSMSSFSGISTVSTASSTTATSPLSPMSVDQSVASSTSSPQSVGGEQKSSMADMILEKPPLSSMSLGLFKAYFEDRMYILQRFVIPK